MLRKIVVSLLLLLFISRMSSRLTHVIPTIPSSPLASHCPASADRCLTLTELIDSNTEGSHVLQSGEKVVFLSGMHVVHGTQNSLLHVYNLGNITFQGQQTATIICKADFHFHFTLVSNLYILGIHFQNCRGHEKNATLYIDKGSRDVLLHEIEIKNNNTVGIVLESTRSFVNITNSNIATGTVGVYSWGNLFEYSGYLHRFLNGLSNRVNIINTTFNGSCLEFTTIYEVPYAIKNTTFRGCNCWPILHGTEIDITLEDVTISDNDSPHIMYANGSDVTITGQCHFYRNKGIIVTWNSLTTFYKAKVEFTNNTVFSNRGLAGALIYPLRSTIYFQNSHVIFATNYGQQCGGILATAQSELHFTRGSTVEFIGNHGEKGGALSLYQESTLNFHDDSNFNLTLNFLKNKAKRGGAIYVDDSSYTTNFGHNLTKGFIHLRNFQGRISLRFSNNFAEMGGNDIYGGWVDWYVPPVPHTQAKYNPNISEVLGYNYVDVSSTPIRVCMCTDNIPDCSKMQDVREIHPGQTVSLKVVAVGQRFGMVVTFVAANFITGVSSTSAEITHQGKIDSFQGVQGVERKCTTLVYTIMSPNKEENLTITPVERKNYPIFDPTALKEHPHYDLLFQQFTIILKVKGCPLAFHFDKINHKCICLPSLSLLGLTCNLDTYKVLRSEHQWVGMAYVHTIPEENPGMIAHQNCPLDYCKTDKASLSIDMEFPDYQCSSNRGGILCGACQTNFSSILGSSRCKKCSHIMLFAIIPGVLLAGILLIIFLMLLNLTVSVGTINGLIFYANLVQAQHSNYFSSEISNSFLSKFIAWLNLDLGIETCLYDGLNSYAKIWLQFLFPLYIWLLMATIIISSHYSTIASRLIGRNAVQVLATLFLLSYTKLLRVIIAVFSSTVILYPDGHTVRVWLYDGNVEFLKGKHLALFITSLLLLIFLSIPYTFSLVTIQWLLKLSNYRILFWIRKLKPLFDAYTGPYKDNHRYWTGFLLLVRITVLITFTLNKNNNPSINHQVIIVISIGLLTWLYFTQWLYRSLLNNFLEMIFVCNIGITSVAILFELVNNGRFSVVTQTSTGFSFVIFILVILYHAQDQILQTKYGSKLKTRLLDNFPSNKNNVQTTQKQVSEVQIKEKELPALVEELM